MIADYRRRSEMLIRRGSDIEKAMKQAEANLNIEGLHVSDHGDELIRAKLRGEISHEEFLKRAAEASKQK
jgi:predicted component of type VI protein secretion system